MTGVWDNSGVWGNATPPIAWANRPANPPVNTKLPLDLGDGNYREMVWNGSMWLPPSGGGLNYPKGFSTPLGTCGPCTIGNNGAVTGMAAIPYVYPGLYLYLKANALYTGSPAGFYWYVPSSTTAGTFYGNTYTPGNGAAPTAPSVLTPIVATGPGAYTATTTGITYYSWTLPGGLLGKNGRYSFKSKLNWNASANGKTFAVWLNATSILANYSANAGQAQAQVEHSFANSGYANKQDGSGCYYGYVSTANNLSGSVDTSVDQGMAITVTLAANTDWFIVSDFYPEIFPR